MRQGRPAVRELLRLLIRRPGARWVLVAAFLPLLFALVVLPVYLALGNRLELGGWGRLVLLPVAFVAAIPFGPLAEELGWRGYGLPRLLERLAPLPASLLLGLIWTIWHVPLFWAPAGTSISGQPVTALAVALYLALLSGYSVIYTWLHQRTGSVLVAVLLHAGFNAELHRFFFAPLPDGHDWLLERMMLVPLWAFALWLVASGRLGRTTTEASPPG